MDEKKITKNIRTKLIVVISITFLLCVLGLSYAYFTIQVGGNEEASSIDVTAARLSLIYTDVQIVMGDLEKPGWTDTKVFTVENDGTDTVPYIIKWRELEVYYYLKNISAPSVRKWHPPRLPHIPLRF